MSTGGGCEAFPDRDEWCNTALSRTQLEALRVRGAKLYCSAECASHGGEFRRRPLLPPDIAIHEHDVTQHS